MLWNATMNESTILWGAVQVFPDHQGSEAKDQE